AVEILTANIESIPSHLLHERFGHPSPVSVFPRVWLAWSHAERGDFRLAIRRGEEALAIATAAGSRFGRIEAAFGLGLARLRQGDNEEAIRELERGYPLCQEPDLPMLHVITSCHLGYAYASADRLAEGLRLIGDALDRADSMMVVFGQSVWLAWRAEALLRAGRAEDAEHTAGEALALAHHRRERGNEAWILQILGEIAARREAAEFASAEAHYCAALALANQGGMRPLVAHCHLALGQLYRRAGTRERGNENLMAAVAMFREMDMRFWRARAEAELGESS